MIVNSECGFVYMAEEEITTTESCLACGDPTKSGNRRVLGENDRVFCLWKSILESELDINPSVIDEFSHTHRYMSRNCYNRYQAFLTTYDI